MRKIFSTLLASTAICALVSSASHAATLPAVSSGTLQLQLEANVGVISSGGLVSAWNDQSGNGFNATQSNTALQPILVQNASANGLEPAILFNGNRTGTGSFLSNLTGQLPTGSNTVFMVYKPLTNQGGAGNEEIPFEWGTESNGQMRAFYLINSPAATINVGFAQYGGGDLGTVYPVPAGTNHLGSWTDTSSGTSPNLAGSFTFYDRTSGSSSDTLEGTGNTTGSTTPPAGFELGGGDIPTLYNYPFAGDISAILVYSGVLSGTDRLAVENYLYAEYFATPEPASVVALVGLCGMGLVGLAFRRRRTMKAAAR